MKPRGRARDRSLEDVLDVALAGALAVPDASRTGAAGAPFAPAVPTGSADLLDRVVAALGRDPGWTP